VSTVGPVTVALDAVAPETEGAVDGEVEREAPDGLDDELSADELPDGPPESVPPTGVWATWLLAAGPDVDVW
jgi:hypothetical protein